MRPIDRIVESFRTGRGVPQSAYPEMAYDGMDRFTAGWFENLLLPVWIPAVGLGERLDAGIDVADVGCGRGRALVKMAKAFPRSRFVGLRRLQPQHRQGEASSPRRLGSRIECASSSSTLPRGWPRRSTW